MKEINILDIKGVNIGHADNEQAGTGCTVVLCKEGATAGVDVRGGAPATRETDLLDPLNMVEKIHAVMLSGGSAYGLDACSGVMQYLEEQNCGFDMQVAKVPIVCGASLFDLTVGDAHVRPDKAMGYEACLNAETTNVVSEGNHGAGTGASIGKLLGMDMAMKSGIGVYAVEAGGVQVAAIVAVNAVGNVVDQKTQDIMAGIYDRKNQQLISAQDVLYKGLESIPNGNTTIGCIITNAKLSKAQAKKIASIAHDGYARSIRPVHTMSDGDTIFTIALGDVEVLPDAVGMLASDVMAIAINRAVNASNSAYGLPARKDIGEQ